MNDGTGASRPNEVLAEYMMIRSIKPASRYSQQNGAFLARSRG